MSKRLTDTAKWKNPWFRKLPTKYKLLFLYLLDECDNAGVIHLDWEIIAFTLNEAFLKAEFDSLLGDKFSYISDDKIIIKKFMTYQDNYNSPMMRKHIEKLLRSHGILEAFEKGKFG